MYVFLDGRTAPFVREDDECVKAGFFSSTLPKFPFRTTLCFDEDIVVFEEEKLPRITFNPDVQLYNVLAGCFSIVVFFIITHLFFFLPYRP